MISKKALDEFKVLYKNHFKEELSDAETLERATNLLNLYRAVYGNTSLESLNNKTKPENK